MIKMICFKKEECTHPKWIEWCKKSEEESLKIAEKNEWYWYTEWYDAGNILRYQYEKVDTSKNVSKKYGGYDRWNEKHKIGTSNVFLGIDGCFHESNTPIRQWTIYNPCTNKECPYNQGEYANQDECGYFGSNERQDDCFNDLFASIQAFIDVCGIEDLDKFAKKFNIHQDIIGWFKYGEKYFKNKKRDDKMNADEARKLTAQNEERQNKIAKLIKEGEKKVKSACNNGKRETDIYAGYCINGRPRYPEVIEHFEKLGYKLNYVYGTNLFDIIW